MKYLIIALLLSGCGATRVNYTIFVKEKDSSLANLKGDSCIESGYQLDQDGKRLITFYSNCDIHYYRVLEEFEIKNWPKGKVDGKTQSP